MPERRRLSEGLAARLGGYVKPPPRSIRFRPGQAELLEAIASRAGKSPNAVICDALDYYNEQKYGLVVRRRKAKPAREEE